MSTEETALPVISWPSSGRAVGALGGAVLTVRADAGWVERRLAAGDVCCPGWGSVLSPWGWAVERVVRGEGGRRGGGGGRRGGRGGGGGGEDVLGCGRGGGLGGVVGGAVAAGGVAWAVSGGGSLSAGWAGSSISTSCLCRGGGAGWQRRGVMSISDAGEGVVAGVLGRSGQADAVGAGPGDRVVPVHADPAGR